MKRASNIFAICTFSLIALSCSKENSSISSVEPSKEQFTFASGLRGGAVKSQLVDAFGTTAWSEGDALSVFSIDAVAHSNNRAESVIDVENPSKAVFTGLIEEGTTRFVAIYPYNATATYDGGCISTVIPVCQNATIGSFANGAEIALAVGNRTPGEVTGQDVDFKHLCSVLSFTLPSNITFADKITVASKSGANMAGDVVVDCMQETIISASASSVILNGSFQCDTTYFITVAPGFYEGGFKFVVETKEGNKYVRETTKDITTEAGVIYPLGTLSLVVNDTQPQAVASIQHTQNALGQLNGTSVKLTVSDIPAEFESALTVSALLKNSDGVVVRSYTGAPTDDVLMEVENECVYLPQGPYTLEASYSNGSSKSYNITATNPESPAPQFEVNEGSYTSYNYGVGVGGFTKDLAKANTMDNSTAWINGSVSIDSTILAKYGEFTYSYDGQEVAVEGNNFDAEKTSQSWAAHDFSAKCVFDGVTVVAEKTLHVTGLPYIVRTKVSQPEGWTKGGSMDSGGNCQIYSCNEVSTSESYCISPEFHAPAVPIDITVLMECYAYGGVIPSCYTGKVYISASDVDCKDNLVHSFTKAVSELPFAVGDWTYVSTDLEFTESVSSVCIHVEGKRTKGTFGIINLGVVSKNVAIGYR